MSEIVAAAVEDSPTYEVEGPSAQDMIQCLIREKSMTAMEISEALGLRVSRRTIYRWLKAESEPQQGSDLVALRKLYEERTTVSETCVSK